MTLTRREALLGTVCSLPLLNSRFALAASAAVWPSPLLIAIGGIDLDSTAARLKAVLEPFVERNLAVFLAVDPVGGSGTRLEPQSQLAETLRDYAVSYPHLVEVGLDIGTLKGSPYFDLRLVSDAQAALTRAINRGGHIPWQNMLTAASAVTSTPPGAVEDFAGLRAAGIRTIVHASPNTGEHSDNGYWMTGTGVAKVFDSGNNSVLDTNGRQQAASRIARNLGRESAAKTPLVLQVGLGELTDLSDSDLHDYAVELSDGIAALRDGDGVRSLTPYALYTQNRDGPVRYVIVRIDDYNLFPALNADHQDFARTLLAAGIPVTDAVIPGGNWTLARDPGAVSYLKGLSGNVRFETAVHGLDHGKNELAGLTREANLERISQGLSKIDEASGKVPRILVPPNNAYDQATLQALGDLGVSMTSAGRGSYDRVWGLDGNGVLHMSNTFAFEKDWSSGAPYLDVHEMLESFGTRDDAVLMVHPKTADTPEKRRRIWQLLKQLEEQPGTELVNCGGYYDRLLSSGMNNLGLLQTARRSSLAEKTAGSAMSDQEPLLLQDAAKAWEYFDRWWDVYGGLVPATAWEESGQVQGYAYATMWDVASLIMANISAHRLGIIDQQRFEATIDRILTFLGGENYRSGGVVLPAAERPIGKSGSGARGGFDSADTGRLLIALKTLDGYTAGNFPIDDLVAGWTLAASIVDGEMCDLRAGRATSVHSNGYAHYAARGYALWGVHARPVFENPYPAGSVDSAMFILDTAEKRGRIATEPHTTEEIELGASEVSTVMADVIHAAQVQRYEEEGKLTCASEGPVDQPPYFTYQGLQLGPDGTTWVVDAPSEGQVGTVRGKDDSMRVVSTKGCFLWAAARPGEYSERLLQHARRARTNGFGFSAGTYEESGEAVALADVNTNGLILEAISFMLNGREPLLDTKESHPASLITPSDRDTAKS